jgi:hypothetical protein
VASLSGPLHWPGRTLSLFYFPGPAAECDGRSHSIVPVAFLNRVPTVPIVN